MTVLALKGTRLTISDQPLDYEEQHRNAIDAQWQKRLASNDRIWNGPFYLFTDVEVREGVLYGTAHRTDFATFLFWRQAADKSGVIHITGTTLPRTTDGALLAIRMADHTANAGQIYFPAGSLDVADLVDGRLNIKANVRRELKEETGFDLQVDPDRSTFVGVFDEGAWHVAVPCLLDADVDECARQISAHQKSGGDDELAGVLGIFSPQDALVMKPYACKLAQWYFDHR